MKPTRADIILIAIVATVAAVLLGCLWIFHSSGRYAVVTVNGEEIARISLENDGEQTVNKTHTVIVEDGFVSIVEAPCPDRICVRHPSISRTGETIVCLPYHLTVTAEEGSTHE